MSQCQPRPPKSQLENRQAANRTTAIVVPALLIGIVSYVTWIVVVLIGGECCLYLLAEMHRSKGSCASRVEEQKHLDRFEPSIFQTRTS
jgi:hypothetical protein